MKSRLPLMVIPLICLVILTNIPGNPLNRAAPPNLHPGLEVITARYVSRLEEIARNGVDGKALAFNAEDGTIRIWGVKAQPK